MEELINIVNRVSFQSMTWLLLIPAALMGFDILTGLIHAFVSDTFKSSKMRAGLGKKAGEIAIILIGLLFTYGMNLPEYILKGVALYIVFMEFMSVLENLNKLGVPIPGFIAKALNNLDEALKADDVKEINKRLEEIEKRIDK